MPIDPSIALGYQFPQERSRDPFDTLGKALSLREMIESANERQALNREQIEKIRLERQTKEAGIRSAEQIKGVFQQFAKGGDWKKLPDALRGIGSPEAIKAATEFETALTNKEKEAAETRAKQIETARKQIEGFTNAMGVLEKTPPELQQGVYSGIAADFRQRGWFPEGFNVPEQFDPRQIAAWKAELLDQTKQFELFTKQEDERRKKDLEPATKQKAEAEAGLAQLKATGQEPTQPLDAAKLKLDEIRNQIQDRHNKAMENNAARASASGMDYRTLGTVTRLGSQLDSNPTVKDFKITAGKAENVKKILDSGISGPSGPRDLAVVFEFMKGLDPESVVRESEYAAAAKSGNLFKGYMAKFNGYLNENGGFLPPEVKSEFRKILDSKLEVSRKQVKGIYDDFARRINKATGRTDGEEWLTDYAEIMAPKATPGSGITLVNRRPAP